MTGQEFLNKMKMEGVTQADIAKRCKLKSSQAVQKWSRKKNEQVEVPPKHWVTVANMLRISISSLGPSNNTVSGNVTASEGGIAQQSGRDSTVSRGHSVSLSPTKVQLISLIESVATEDYCMRQVKVLQEAERLMSGK